MPETLTEWLDYQQNLHARGIDLGLDRVRAVAERMRLLHPAPLVITVGGTNGKGSTVAFLDAILSAAGKRVGCYTSPHLERYNERVRIAGVDVDDPVFVEAFDEIEAARGEISLTYFEFGTLAALWIFAQSTLDVVVLEVGLGGRLDAVNIIDADVAIVTTIALDHQDYLGDDLAGIAREKAGIFRAQRPAVIGEAVPVAALVDAAIARDSQLVRCGHEYDFVTTATGWSWSSGETTLELPLPSLDAACQCANAAAAIAAVHALRDRLGWNPQAITQGVYQANIPARLQRFSGAVEFIIDVAHNPQAAAILADWLAAHPISGRTLAVFSALADKDVVAIVQPLASFISRWFVCGLEQQAARGATARDVALRLMTGAPAANHECFADPGTALAAAWGEALPGDRVLAFGSFYLAADALGFAREHGMAAAVK
ncbi:bifunctional tetrahydrofolate synthase/dihydrofolate synthase [Pseudolysobacter antarcticus]|uniref:Dihydrofolate synthase/folylpolyglutamate synthase n=1 Tax=Pseudolysobacter antarcticus TaxID=2511995 RepID=A0A411HLH0_9GAMM|nr:bifunctional tetrahydrofolate synthase/dihydrofolate synthase [Pseudolysobacter antarcticus]QBB71376.1 bifunctional tetrahydrofolate synthase/dihydrofolate synthase [Pseudolysobacter antarcticus]